MPRNCYLQPLLRRLLLLLSLTQPLHCCNNKAWCQAAQQIFNRELERLEQLQLTRHIRHQQLCQQQHGKFMQLQQELHKLNSYLESLDLCSTSSKLPPATD